MLVFRDVKAESENAKSVGRDLDYNAYTEALSPQADQRMAAGYIHLGWTHGQDTNNEDHLLACCSVAKQLDFFLGLPSVLLDPHTKRKATYGKAGAFRPKPYGLEYRLLSNFWLSDERLTWWVFNSARTAFRLLEHGWALIEEAGLQAQRCINKHDREKAYRLIVEYSIPASPFTRREISNWSR